MHLHEMRTAVLEAQRTVRSAELQHREIAEMLLCNLRSITKRDHWMDHDILIALKKELTQYNATTRKWKN